MPKTYKLMMLGEIGVGKTSIVRRLVFNKFDADYKATIGVDIYTYQMQVDEAGGIDVELAIWDIDGDLGDSLFNHVYIQGSSGALVVGDAARPSTQQTMIRFGTQFQDVMPGRPLAFVLNKIDLINEGDHLDVSAFARHSAVPLAKTSAKTGENIVPVFSSLTREIIKREL